MRAVGACRNLVPLQTVHTHLNWTDALNFTDAHGVPRLIATELLETAEGGWLSGQAKTQENKTDG